MLIDRARNLYQQLPEGFRRAALVRRRERFWVEAGILFIHVPKAAGTAINEALYGRFMGHVRASDIHRWGSARVKALPSFAVTRNPWERLVSAYRFAKRGGGIGGRRPGQVRHAEKYQIPEFETFERFVIDWLAFRDPCKLDFVFQPQWLFVCDGRGELLVDHVGRMDDLAPTTEFIRSRLGRVPQISQANRSGEGVDYRDFYNPGLTETVARLYERDISLFGYKF